MNVCLSVFVFAVLDRSLVASCKDSIGWMFSKMDTNGDLYLDQVELAAINLDKYEVCIRPFFNSCDSYRDGKVSTAEWCLCFWRESEYSGEGVRVVPLCCHLPLQTSRRSTAPQVCSHLRVLCWSVIICLPAPPLVPRGVKPQGAENLPAAS